MPTKDTFPLGSPGWMEEHKKLAKDLEERLNTSSQELAAYKSLIAGDLSGVLNRLTDLESPNYTTYEGAITQDGTDDPTVYIFKNTLEDPIAWSRIDVGTYEGVLEGAFPEGRTILELGQTGSGSGFTRVDDDTVQIVTYGNAIGTEEDGRLTNTSLKIKVYNE